MDSRPLCVTFLFQNVFHSIDTNVLSRTPTAATTIIIGTIIVIHFIYKVCVCMFSCTYTVLIAVVN